MAMRLQDKLRWWLLPLPPFDVSWNARERGYWGEKAVARHLWRQGYRILEHRWTLGRTDIDLIAANTERYLFCEVKLRDAAAEDPWYDLVEESRVERLAMAAGTYLRQARQQRVNIRFDGFLVQPNRTNPKRPVITVREGYINSKAVSGWKGVVEGS